MKVTLTLINIMVGASLVAGLVGCSKGVETPAASAPSAPVAPAAPIAVATPQPTEDPSTAGATPTPVGTPGP